MTKDRKPVYVQCTACGGFAEEPDATTRTIRAAAALINGVKNRHPGEKLRCPDMIELEAALKALGVFD